MKFVKAERNCFAKLCGLYQDVIGAMRQKGLRQWEWDVYPTSALLENDLEKEQLYLAMRDGAIVGAFVLCAEMEEEYSRIEWHYGVKPATLHRFVMLPEVFDEEGIRQALDFVRAEATRLGYDSLRVDVCPEEEKMLCRFERDMTREAGRLYFERFGMEYVCFEAPLTESCPMLPMRMYPAYRHGEMTPWGGEQLRTVYGREIPDERTGEALEVSAVPGLESRTSQGESLTELMKRNGEKLTGEKAKDEFPLLLKLLAAKQSLSVQVHPDDGYARMHENKLGKTEAWVILRAEEKASILYGMKDGASLEALKQGLESGEDIEPLIDRVYVKPGDVYYMPAGMVHAIGAGILLYEIQQSSDVTYRLWDFNRTNDKGEKRPLHIRQSLDVIDPELKGQRAQMPESGNNELVNLLDVPAFRLDCALVNGECLLEREEESFRILTALSSLLLSWEGDAVQLKAGDTVLLPAACPPVTLMGVGRALISKP